MFPEIHFSHLPGNLLGFLTSDSMDFRISDIERLEEQLMGYSEVALGIGGRDAPFIGPKKVDVIERNSAALRLRHDRFEKILHDPSAGQRHAIFPARTAPCFNCVQPCAGGRLREFVAGRECCQLERLHRIKMKQDGRVGKPDFFKLTGAVAASF